MSSPLGMCIELSTALWSVLRMCSILYRPPPPHPRLDTPCPLPMLLLPGGRWAWKGQAVHFTNYIEHAIETRQKFRSNLIQMDPYITCFQSLYIQNTQKVAFPNFSAALHSRSLDIVLMALTRKNPSTSDNVNQIQYCAPVSQCQRWPSTSHGIGWVEYGTV